MPKEYEQCKTIGVVHAAPHKLHLINITQELIEKHRVRQGGYYEITMNKIGPDYMTGQDTWPRILSFADRI